MMGSGSGMGGWGFIGFLMLLGLVLLVAVVVWAIGGGIRRGDPDGPSPSGAPPSPKPGCCWTSGMRVASSRRRSTRSSCACSGNASDAADRPQDHADPGWSRSAQHGRWAGGVFWQRSPSALNALRGWPSRSRLPGSGTGTSVLHRPASPAFSRDPGATRQSAGRSNQRSCSKSADTRLSMGLPDTGVAAASTALASSR